MFLSRSHHPLFAFCFATLFAASASVSAQSVNCTGTQSDDDLTARGFVTQGIAAYKSARYAEAITFFQKATDIAPCLTMARLYLGTAQAQNVVPGLDTPDNVSTAQQAVENFRQVLALEPHNINAMKQAAAVYFSIKKFDDAREWQKKVLVEDPNDYEAAYTIGVIDWTQAHHNVLTVLATVGMVDDGMGNAHATVQILEEIKQENSSLVAEALQYLTQAVAVHPDYDDAMAYINLVYRRQADIDYQNPTLRDEDLAKAQEWTRKAMLTRKEKEEKMAASPAQP